MGCSAGQGERQRADTDPSLPLLLTISLAPNSSSRAARSHPSPGCARAPVRASSLAAARISRVREGGRGGTGRKARERGSSR